MDKFYHNKLIRDKIPEIIKANNGKYELKEMEESEFKRELRKKLIEEAKEVIEAEGKEATTKELADVLELIKSIAESENVTFNLVEEEQEKRREKRGGFKKKLFLIWSDAPAGK